MSHRPNFGDSWPWHLADAIQGHPVPIVVPDPGTEHGRALVLALGAQIAPEPTFRGRPESFYREKVAEIRARLRAQGLKDVTPGRERVAG